MGTINIISHCMVKDGRAYTGTREEIVNQVVKFRFENRCLIANVKSFVEVIYHSYSHEWTDEEMYRDAVQFLFNSLRDYGFKHYIEKDF